MKTQKSHPREWVDGSDPTYMQRRAEFLNPTNGSWWIVQIRPLKQTGRADSKAILVSCVFHLVKRLDLNHPPTSVGGLRKSPEVRPGRLDLKNPPTPVGGISVFSRRFGAG